MTRGETAYIIEEEMLKGLLYHWGLGLDYPGQGCLTNHLRVFKNVS